MNKRNRKLYSQLGGPLLLVQKFKVYSNIFVRYVCSGEAKGRACRARHDHKFPKVGFSNIAKNSFYSAYKTQIDHVYFANVN